jgi:hypothetical protein
MRYMIAYKNSATGDLGPFFVGLQNSSDPGDHTNETPFALHDLGAVFSSEEDARAMLGKFHIKCRQGWGVYALGAV